MTSIFKTIANKLYAVTDGIYDRASMGNLDAYTGPNGVTSPAQYGFRAIDQNGNAIFDSMGLISVMTFLGTAGNGDTGYTVTSTADVMTTGTDITFSLTRPGIVFATVNMTGKTSGAGGTYAYGSVYLDGAQDFLFALFDKNNTGYVKASASSILSLARLSAGSHTVDLRLHVDAGQTWINYVSGVQLWLAGA